MGSEALSFTTHCVNAYEGYPVSDSGAHDPGDIAVNWADNNLAFVDSLLERREILKGQTVQVSHRD